MSVTVPVTTDEEAFQPLYPDQDEDTILARWMEWANEGVDPVTEAGSWVDVREGGHWRTAVMPGVREFARAYDLFGTEVPMSAFVLWAWEVYLDDLAAAWDVLREPAASAQVTVTFEGAPGTPIEVGTVVGVAPGTGSDPAPTFRVTEAGVIAGGGAVDLPTVAETPGAAGNVGVGAITSQVTPLPGVTFTNAAAAFGGRDVEDDDSLRRRALEAVKGKGPGAVRDYVRWAGDWPGVGRVTVTPVWDGASTVLVMIADPNGQPLPDALVTALQTDLDPVPGKGSGTAPVGAHVTVRTPAALDVDLAFAATYLSGYSWDGSGQTVAVGPAVTAAWTQYLLSVEQFGSVRYERLKGILATAVGVDAVTAFTANGAELDIAVDDTHAAQLGTVTPG